MALYLGILMGAAGLVASSVATVPAPMLAGEVRTCAVADVWTNSWDANSGTGVLQRYSVDLETGDLTLAASAPLARPYGDIGIASHGGDVWGTDFAASPDDAALFRINPDTGAEIERVAFTPALAVADAGSASDLNSLTFRPDGSAYLGSGWSLTLWVVDPASGTWDFAMPTLLPPLEDGPGYDNWPAGDFLRLESGEVLAVMTVAEAATIWNYLVIFDPVSGASRIIGQFDDSDVFYGAAQAGRWIYLSGERGQILRLETALLPRDENPARDLTGLLSVVIDDEVPLQRYGMASTHDAGCAETPEAEEILPVTGGGASGVAGTLAVILAGAGLAIALRKRSAGRRVSGEA